MPKTDREVTRLLLAAQARKTSTATEVVPNVKHSDTVIGLLAIVVVLVILVTIGSKITWSNPHSHNCPSAYPHYTNGVCYAGNDANTTDYVLPSH